MKHGPHYDYVVVCYNLKGQFVSTFATANECAKAINSHPRSVDKILRKGNGTLHGLQMRWIRKDRFTCEPIKPYEKEKIKYEFKRVAKVDVDGKVIEIYPSIKQAAKENGTSPKSIREVIKGNQKKANGYAYKLM